MRRLNGSTGFTIVELLIVIVVIAILAAIAVVAYNGIRQRAESSAQKSELSQLQRKIQTDILKDHGTSVSISTPIVKSVGGEGTTRLSTPLTVVQDITLYGVFDTFNNPAASNWSTIIALNPTSTNNAFRLRTGATDSSVIRGFHATSVQTNRDVSIGSFLNTTARHVGWISANATSIYAGVDTTEQSLGLSAHTGWTFETISHSSNGSYASVAALVFPEYHDEQTRRLIVRWLAKEYNVSL
jgi:prepilin-type N-terminal cleavage/methylation domain-containing protein